MLPPKTPAEWHESISGFTDSSPNPYSETDERCATGMKLLGLPGLVEKPMTIAGEERGMIVIGHNLTEETRTAVFYDFVKTPQLFRRNAALAEQPSENGDGPPPLDMWEDWSCETRAAAAAAAAVHAAPPMPKL